MSLFYVRRPNIWFLFYRAQERAYPVTVAIVTAEYQIERDNQPIVRIRVDEIKLRHLCLWLLAGL
jgi:hypothetical protein